MTDATISAHKGFIKLSQLGAEISHGQFRLLVLLCEHPDGSLRRFACGIPDLIERGGFNRQELISLVGDMAGRIGLSIYRDHDTIRWGI